MRDEVVQKLLLRKLRVPLSIGNAFLNRELKHLDEIVGISKNLFITRLCLHSFSLPFIFPPHIINSCLFNYLFNSWFFLFLKDRLFFLCSFLLFGRCIFVNFIKHPSHMLIALIVNETINNVVSMIH